MAIRRMLKCTAKNCFDRKIVVYRSIVKNKYYVIHCREERASLRRSRSVQRNIIVRNNSSVFVNYTSIITNKMSYLVTPVSTFITMSLPY